MRAPVSVARCRDLVATSRELAWAGFTSRTLRVAVEAGEWVRLQRNRYIRGDVWKELWPEGRHLAALVAADAEMTTGSSVFSHESAAVLHGLPLYRHRFGPLHVTVRREAAMPSRGGLFRHRDALSAADIVMIDGIRCTSLERTVYDLARTVGAEAALSAADAALGEVAGDAGGEYRVNVAEGWRHSLLSRAAGSPGGRGVRRAREVLELADGRAESPGESASRLRWHRAGFRALDIQPLIVLSGGRRRRCDLGIGEIRAFFEFDGRVKYLDPATRDGRSAEQVVVDEKLREDEIRAVTGWRVLRAVDEDIASDAAFADYLARFGIR